MADFLNVPSSFFMFYLEDFSTKLVIPEEFVNEYKTFLQQDYIELKTYSSSRSWVVKAKEMRNEKWFIKGGWSKFAKDNHLLPGYLLTFRISGESSLHVEIFGRDSCMKEPSSSPPRPSAASHDGTWRFIKKLKDYTISSSSRMDIPYLFAWGTGLSTECDIEVENSRGRRWPVKITDRKMEVFSITTGWVQFIRDNNFQTGDILLFECVPNSGNVVKVVEMEEEAGAVLLARARKGGLVM